MSALKVTKQQCRFAQDCIFLPLCLFVHCKEDKNDQVEALSRNISGWSVQVEKCVKMQTQVESVCCSGESDTKQTAVESVPCSGESDTNCPLKSVHCSPQLNTTHFPEIDFSTTFFNAEDFSSDFEMLAMSSNQGTLLVYILSYS